MDGAMLAAAIRKDYQQRAIGATRIWQTRICQAILAKKDWRGAMASLTSGRAASRGALDMKAKIIVTPKKAVLDPQGKTVQNALEQMGYKGIGAVHVGKYLEIDLPGADAEVWRAQIDGACHKILSNPVIEDYRFVIE